MTDEQLEQFKQELREYWEENIYQKNPPVNNDFLPKAEKEQLEKIKNGEIKELCRKEMKKRIDAEEKYKKLLSNFQEYVEKYKLKDQGDKDDK